MSHASCGSQAGGYSSDDEEGTPAGCPCLWHPVAIEERASHLAACRAWPGPTCGTCWSASCACGYVFDAAGDAHGRWPNGRLRSATLAPRNRASVEHAAPAPALGGPLAEEGD